MNKLTLTLAVLISLTACTQTNNEQSWAGAPTAEDYEAAGRLLERNLAGLVKNAAVVPHWLSGSARFWYKRDTQEGQEYVLVDIGSGEKSPAFDHEALAVELSELLKEPVTSENLGLSNESLSDDGTQLTAHAGGMLLTCDLIDTQCSEQPLGAPRSDLLVSPEGSKGARIESDNLVLVNLADNSERALTEDGGAYFSYGKLPDAGLITITLRKTGRQLPPWNASFSPDSRFLVIPRLDERDVSVNPFVEWVPDDGALRPIYYDLRSAYTGDRNIPEAVFFSFDTHSGEGVEIKAPQGYEDAQFGYVLGWSQERAQAFLGMGTHGAKKGALVLVDLTTGDSRVVIEESSETRVEFNSLMYSRPNVRLVDDGEEVIWYSDRSGFGHLYLYDAQTGELKNSITSGEWQVGDLLAVDEVNRMVYFTALGRESGRDPYLRHLYRASLEGGEVILLTPENADHHFTPEPIPQIALLSGTPPMAPVIRPDLGVFIDTYSTVSEPPVTLLRSTLDGTTIAELERADASALFDAGWQAPVRQSVKAADGTTDIWTVYWAPRRELPGGKHPVIDAAYGGPQVIVAPRNFIEAFSATNPFGQAAQARLGFAVVTTDGRGTPLRSNAFRDAGYTEFTQVGIDDHIAAIEQLADRYPELDTSRVGIHGWSWGGTFSAQAILTRPDFYKVCVTGAGVYDYAPLYPGFESATGIPQYSDGSIYRTKTGEKPANWDKLDITQMVGNLKGKMQIVYGDLDENVPPSQAFRFIDALTRARKPYDLVYIPGGTHYTAHGAGSAYSIQTRLDYFVEHLMGYEPPADALISYD